MDYILGIDQGGTKTAAMVMDRQGNILGAGRSRGAYHIYDGMETAMEAIHEAVTEACGQAHVKIGEIRTAGAGVTGVDWPEDYTLLHGALVKLTGIENFILFNDVMGAFYSGSTFGHGAVLCAGTGLNAAVRSPKGEDFVFGFYIEDNDQGGSALAQRAILRVFRSAVGLEGQTALTGLFLRESGTGNVDDLLHRYVVDREFARSVKDMVPQIVDCAGGGDTVADSLLREFSGDISRYLRVGLAKFDLLHAETDIVLSGGVLKGSDNLLTVYLKQDIARFAPKAHIVSARFEPVIGAGIAALQATAGSLGPETWDRLEAGALRFGLKRQ